MLRKTNPPTNLAKNTQIKSGESVSTKIVSENSKDKTIPPETTNQVPFVETSTSLPIVDYNITDDMKKVHAKISMFELKSITSQQDIFLWALGKTSVGNTTSLYNGASKSHGTLEFIRNSLTMDVITLCPPFLLNFEIFKYFNVHNFLIDSSALVNIMPLSVTKKINAKWEKTDA